MLFKKGQTPWNKGKHHSEETRRKLSNSARSLWQDPKYKKHMSDTHKGKKVSKETRKRLSEALKGREFSEEWIRKIGDALRGRTCSKEHVLKNRRAHLGKRLSDETKRKISKANKGQIPWMKGKRHTKESREEIGRTSRGEKHWNWKGGLISEIQRIRGSIESKLWRESVFERDGWICQKCSIKGGRLHPHHIENFADYPEVRFEVDNGITFCKGCHKEFHKIYGFKNNTKKQLEEFLR